LSSRESRYLKQATLTPVVNNEKVGYNVPNFVPKKPYLKQAILSVAIGEAEVGNLVLDRLTLSTSQEDPDRNKLLSAIKLLNENNVTESAKILENIDTSKITNIAEEALNTEESFVAKAQKDLEDSFISIVKQNSITNDAVDRLKTELATMKDSIIKEIKASVTPSALSSYRSDISAIFPKPSTLPSFPEDLQPAISEVTRDRVYKVISESSPDSAKFLGATKFFSLPQFTEVQAQHEATHMLSFVAVQNQVIAQRRQFCRAFIDSMDKEPVGYLHLERLKFTPVGYVKGELVYSLPLTPKETVRLSHREWTRTETEYVKIVSTSLETATQESIAEKSELAESVNTQNQHSSGFNASVSASGGYGPVSITTSVGYNSQNAESQSRQSTARRSQEITKTASSRTKQEHKISFRVTTQYEVEEQSFREITNPFDRAIRYDFHRLMKKWRIDLYRYGLRLTYDMLIPEPGSYLLRKYIRLKNINDELAKENPFDLSPSQINRMSWENYSRIYDVSLEPPPLERIYRTFRADKSFSQRTIGYDHLEIALPDGYYIQSYNSEGSEFFVTRNGTTQRSSYLDPLKYLNQTQLEGGSKWSNQYLWRYYYDWSEPETGEQGNIMSITVWITAMVTENRMKHWQVQCYEKLSDAARAQYENKRQRLTQIRDDLLAELNREDALMLRKIEKEEVMKGVLRWLLGPQFSFYPRGLPLLNLSEVGDIEYYDTSTQSVRKRYYEAMLKQGEIIKFLHHAIEWENVIYVLYPYFWTDNYRWDFKQFLYHADYVHRSFLRAGAARVVLTIRPGFEEAFLTFVETLDLNATLSKDHPYVTVAEELKAMANTSYPYTPGANDETPQNLVDTWFEFTPTGALDVEEGGVLE
jgi:hypothetical protein